MARGRVERIFTQSLRAGAVRRAPDEVVVEEPLEIRLDDVLVSTTMRTPGHDFELAAGFCFTEGLLGGVAVQRCRYCATGSAVGTEFNVVTVETGGRAPTPTARLGSTTSSCGLCGSASIEELTSRLEVVPDAGPVPVARLVQAPQLLRESQVIFDRTGSVHGAGAIDDTGRLVVAREDIGRHNAVDKVIGHLLLDGGTPATGSTLVVSSRASFEMVQKAWAAGFSALVAVSGPSALAVATADAAGLILVGFARGADLNLYTGRFAAADDGGGLVVHATYDEQ